MESLALLGLGRIEGEVDPLRIDAALQHIKQGISMCEEMRLRTNIAIGHLFLGEVLDLAGRSKEAMENLKKAEEMYLDMKVSPDSYWLTRTREAMARLEPAS
jgi:tetratricopeptide (TPR) repeat protein